MIKFPGIHFVVLLLCCLLHGVAGAIPITPDFDHFSTGFVLTGAHETVSCSACHKTRMFSGTPRNCISCHNGSLAAGKPARHVQSNNTCDDCHVTASFSQINMEHGAVRGSCRNCHSGGGYQAMPARHIPIQGHNCDACHGTLSWNIGRFSHHLVEGRPCTECHNESMLAGMPSGHPVFTVGCADCHGETNWSPARYNHLGVGDNCDRCHGAYPGFLRGKGANHVTTTLSCTSCHRITAWLPAAYDHSLAAGTPCADCHNGSTATGPGDNHFGTTLACNVCHSVGGWTSISYSHGSPDYPDHGSRLRCNRCHPANNASVNWSSPGYKPACAGCHSGDFRSSKHKKYSSPSTVYYNASELRDCSGSCHVYTDATLTTISSTRNHEHSARSGDW